MTEKQIEKIKNYTARGMKPEEIANIVGLTAEEVNNHIEGTLVQKKDPVRVKKVVEAKIEEAKEEVEPEQTTTKTMGYSTKTGLHTKTTRKVGFGKK